METTAAVTSIAATKRLAISAWRYLILVATLKPAAARVNNKNPASRPGVVLKPGDGYAHVGVLFRRIIFNILDVHGPIRRRVVVRATLAQVKQRSLQNAGR